MSVTCPRCWYEFDNPNENQPEQYFHSEVPNLQAPDEGSFYEISGCRCPECRQFIVWAQVPEGQLIYPRVDLRKYVPDEVHKDFGEACRVLEKSPNASAVLCRRCLHQFIHAYYGVYEQSPGDEIERLVKNQDLPRELAEDLLIVKEYGNFGAHPNRKVNPIAMDVERIEAEWMIDILERLFDFAYLAPERTKERRARLNKKLQTVGMDPLEASKEYSRIVKRQSTIN